MGTFGDALASALQLVFAADGRLLHIVALSLAVSASACVAAALIGIPGGALLATLRFPGRRGLLLLLHTLLALPSVVVGLSVYLLLSRAGPLGAWGILFTPTAMVIAQTLLVLPLVAALTRQLVADAMHGNAEQLRSMGATPGLTALLLLLHERASLATVLLSAFGRAVSEVGAVMIVGGNIDGVTRVMTTAIALETSKGDLALALGLGLVLLGVVACINLAIALLRGSVARPGAGRRPAPGPVA